MSKSVSIVIPVYNVAPYLRECLDSVLTQTFADWEAVCIDDGSIDGSGAILDEYAVRDSRFRVIHQANAGVSAARNAGLDAAQGDWVVFLDGDDVLASAAMERIFEVVGGHNVSIVRYGYEQFEENARPCFRYTKCEPSWFDVSERICGELLRGKNLNCGALAFLRERARDIRFRKFICGEDHLFGLELLLRAHQVVFLDEALYGYRIRKGSYVNSPMTLRKFKDEIGHRLVFLSLARSSNKDVRIGACDWLESYFTHSSLVDVQRIPNEVSDEAWKIWFDCIADYANFEGCSAWTQCLLSICRRFHSKMVSLLLCRYLPAILTRILHVPKYLSRTDEKRGSKDESAERHCPIL